MNEPLRAAVIAASLGMAIAIPANAQSVGLPGGDLTLFAGNSRGANFLVDGSIRRSGDVVFVWNYRVYAEEVPSPEGPVDQDITELEIDCAARTQKQVAVHAFGPSGDHKFSMPAEAATPIVANSTWDFVARVVCDGVQLPPSATVSGAPAARALAHERLAQTGR